MSDNNKAAEQRAQNEKRNFPTGSPATQSQTGYGYEQQKAYENEHAKK